MALTHLFVTVPPDREVPVPASEASAPGATLLRCLPGKVYRLPYTGYTRRRINAGDLIPCKRDGSAPLELHDCAAPEAVELDELGAVVPAAASAPAVAPVTTEAKKGV